MWPCPTAAAGSKRASAVSPLAPHTSEPPATRSALLLQPPFLSPRPGDPSPRLSQAPSRPPPAPPAKHVSGNTPPITPPSPRVRLPSQAGRYFSEVHPIFISFGVLGLAFAWPGVLGSDTAVILRLCDHVTMCKVCLWPLQPPAQRPRDRTRKFYIRFHITNMPHATPQKDGGDIM